MDIRVDYAALGGRIRQYRRLMHMTQAALAESVGISPQFLGNIERGAAIPSIATFLALCYALYIEPDNLLADSLPEDGFASVRPYKLRSSSIYRDAFTDWLEIWWKRSGVADLDTFANMPLSSLPASCCSVPFEDAPVFRSL